jgi:hypothetical protein
LGRRYGRRYGRHYTIFSDSSCGLMSPSSIVQMISLGCITVWGIFTEYRLHRLSIKNEDLQYALEKRIDADNSRSLTNDELRAQLDKELRG